MRFCMKVSRAEIGGTASCIMFVCGRAQCKCTWRKVEIIMEAIAYHLCALQFVLLCDMAFGRSTCFD